MAIRTRDQFGDLTFETVTISAQTDKDKYGKQTFSNQSTSLEGRIINETKLVRDASGQEQVVTGKVIIPGASTGVTLGHKLTLPDNSTPKILTVDEVTDEGEVHHTVITFGLG
jgi:hypothetical protein